MIDNKTIEEELDKLIFRYYHIFYDLLEEIYDSTINTLSKSNIADIMISLDRMLDDPEKNKLSDVEIKLLFIALWYDNRRC